MLFSLGVAKALLPTGCFMGKTKDSSPLHTTAELRQKAQSRSIWKSPLIKPLTMLLKKAFSINCKGVKLNISFLSGSVSQHVRSQKQLRPRVITNNCFPCSECTQRFLGFVVEQTLDQGFRNRSNRKCSRSRNYSCNTYWFHVSQGFSRSEVGHKFMSTL